MTVHFYTLFPVIVASVAVVMDILWSKVDNGWILFSIGIGLAVRTWVEGASGLLGFLSGMVLPVVALGGLFVLRMLGAGDIKLFAALGGIMGIPDIWKCMAVSFLFGAFISVMILITNHDIYYRLHVFYNYIHLLIKTGERRPYMEKGTSHPENFHFTIPVLMSVMLYAGGVY